MKALTVCFVTSREKPKFHWFFDSLWRQIKPGMEIHVLVIDLHRYTRITPVTIPLEMLRVLGSFRWEQSKPSVWQGPNRLVKQDWFAAANARNSAICLCATEHIAFIDDRSVLLDGWLASANEATDKNYMVFGSYEKRHGMIVKSGVIENDGAEAGASVSGKDVRDDYAKQHWAHLTPPYPCPGEWGFGCTLAMPIDWALKINGFDETCDGMGMEDAIFGKMAQNNGFETMFDPRMKIVEDRSPEQLGTVMKREDKGVSPNDRSHALLNMLKDRKTAAHPINLSQIREDVLSGKHWPLPWGPTHDFWDNQPLQEM